MISSSDELDYEPLKFLRCHSKNNDSADMQTQVWDCAFEPIGDGLSSKSYIVATCGGNSVCFIDCVTGHVISKYYTKNLGTLLYSLAWTRFHSVNEIKPLLITGGAKGILCLIDYSINSCILEHQLKCKRVDSINALSFHPTDPGILFCGFNNGEIRICELKKCLSEPNKIELVVINCIPVKNEVFDFAFCLSSKILISSCDDGLITFYYPNKESLRSPVEKCGINMSVVSTQRSLPHSTLVDSVEVLKDGLFACKYALHSCIYICDLKPLRDAHAQNVDKKSLELEPLYILEWSPTDNYFMYMDVNVDSSLLCCGDDKGSLWLYNLNEFLNNAKVTDTNIKPSAIIPWPHLIDHYNDKKRKLNLDVYDIVVDKVVVHSSSEYIVAVTNNNLVCLWKKH